jgi:hypothetical protein
VYFVQKVVSVFVRFHYFLHQPSKVSIDMLTTVLLCQYIIQNVYTDNTSQSSLHKGHCAFVVSEGALVGEFSFNCCSLFVC